jgi:hypothetical protein
MTRPENPTINADLVTKDADPTRHRGKRHSHDRAADPFSPESEARVCERVLGDRRHGLTEPN